MHRRLLTLALLLLTATGAAAAPVHVLGVDGPIGPASAGYVTDGLEDAAAAGAGAVVLRMDTPGGLSSAMRDIIKAILASPVPVIGYVAPSGARAASAGTYILYASHVAAMAPGTNLGAATPVRIGGMPGTPSPQPGDGGGDGDGGDKAAQAPADPMERKLVNDAVAYIRALADMRGRNADWAERAVREAASLPARAAVEKDVVDLMAQDLDALLQAVDGRRVETDAGVVTLATADAAIVRIEPDWRTRLLAVITNPNIAYILMLVGIYGLIFELMSPGAIVPGVLGAICLLLALFAFQALPVNYAGLGLVVLGIAFMISEAFVPSFGALGLGGVVAFAIGSVLLFDADAEHFQLSLALVGGVTAASLLLFLGTAVMAARSYGRPIVSGRQQMIDSLGVVVEDFEREGRVRAHGELWRAESDVPLRAGQRVRVTSMAGLRLHVEPVENGKDL